MNYIIKRQELDELVLPCVRLNWGLAQSWNITRKRFEPHPVYIFKREDDFLIGIVFTQSRRTKGLDNYILEKDPNPRVINNRLQRVVIVPIKDSYKKYGSTDLNYNEFSGKDVVAIKQIMKAPPRTQSIENFRHKKRPNYHGN